KALFGLDDWVKFGWTRDDRVVTRQGGEYQMVPVDLTSAVVQFTALLARGKRMEWVLGYRDARNYVQYQFEDKDFSRTEVVNGKHGKTVKTAHGAKRDAYNIFGIRLSPQFIVTAIMENGAWKTIDEYQPPGGVAAGKFGFHISGKDQLNLSDFKILPN
ncbi:MAG TPA: hypothetical protein VKS01_07300, partial [Bryobacteraceae bacterium]|nr:hypothetical protein [Bryobacteraceae bacterium]